MTEVAVPTISRGGAESGEHGLYVRAPLGPGPSKTCYHTEQQGREDFLTTVDTIRGESKCPALFKVGRVI